MGVLADGPGGVNPDAEYGYSGNDGSISGAAGRTQDVVVRQLKQRFYDSGDFGTNDPWDDVDKMPAGPLLWSILNAIAKSVLKLPGEIWEDINELFDALEWVPDRITEHTAAITRLDDVAAATNTTPAYVADTDDMASFPRIDVECDALSDSSTPPKFRDILDYDHIDDSQDVYLHRGVIPTIRPQVATGTSLGHIYYVPITSNRHALVDTVRWMGGADTSIFSIDYFEVSLCVLNLTYNPDTGLSDGVEKAWTSGDIKDAEADTATFEEIPIAMGSDQETRPGHILMIAFQQTAPGVLQVPRRIAAKRQTNRQRTVPILDAPCYVAPRHTQGIPSVISFSTLTRENRFIPWASVGTKAIPAGGS